VFDVKTTTNSEVLETRWQGYIPQGKGNSPTMTLSSTSEVTQIIRDYGDFSLPALTISVQEEFPFNNYVVDVQTVETKAMHLPWISRQDQKGQPQFGYYIEFQPAKGYWFDPQVRVQALIELGWSGEFYDRNSAAPTYVPIFKGASASDVIVDVDYAQALKDVTVKQLRSLTQNAYGGAAIIWLLGTVIDVSVPKIALTVTCSKVDANWSKNSNDAKVACMAYLRFGNAHLTGYYVAEQPIPKAPGTKLPEIMCQESSSPAGHLDFEFL